MPLLEGIIKNCEKKGDMKIEENGKIYCFLSRKVNCNHQGGKVDNGNNSKYECNYKK